MEEFVVSIKSVIVSSKDSKIAYLIKCHTFYFSNRVHQLTSVKDGLKT